MLLLNVKYMVLGIRVTLLILYYIIITLYFILSVGQCTDMGIMYKRCLGNAFQLRAKYQVLLGIIITLNISQCANTLKTYTP